MLYYDDFGMANLKRVQADYPQKIRMDNRSSCRDGMRLGNSRTLPRNPVKIALPIRGEENKNFIRKVAPVHRLCEERSRENDSVPVKSPVGEW